MGGLGGPGGPKTHQKVGARGPPPSEMASEAAGAAQTPKMVDSRPLENSKFPPKVQPRLGEPRVSRMNYDRLHGSPPIPNLNSRGGVLLE